MIARKITGPKGEFLGVIGRGIEPANFEKFFATVALGPGTWTTIPPDIQQAMIENAPTFLDEANDPEQLDFDLESISRFSKPVLLTLGDQSPPTFAPVVARLSGALPHAEIVTLPGAGHVPHETHPHAYVEAIIEFTHKHSA